MDSDSSAMAFKGRWIPSCVCVTVSADTAPGILAQAATNVDVPHQSCIAEGERKSQSHVGTSWLFGGNAPGPSSTDNGFPVRKTGSPMVMPDCESIGRVGQRQRDERGPGGKGGSRKPHRLLVHLDGDLVG